MFFISRSEGWRLESNSEKVPITLLYPADESEDSICESCADTGIVLCPCGRCWDCCERICGPHRERGLECACYDEHGRRRWKR
jgi:hypothetical protein